MPERLTDDSEVLQVLRSGLQSETTDINTSDKQLWESNKK